MTTPSEKERSAHPLASETSKETASSNGDDETPVVMLPWLRTMPLPSATAKIGIARNTMAETTSMETHESRNVAIEAENEDEVRPGLDLRPTQKLFEIKEGSSEDAHLPRAAQLSLIPALQGVLAETAELDKQAATIDQIASALKTSNSPVIEGSSPFPGTSQSARIEYFARVVPKTEWQLDATLPQIVQNSAKLAEIAAPKPSVSGRRVGSRPILATAILSVAALYIWFSDWHPLPTVSSYILTRLPSVISTSERKSTRDVEPESSSKREKSPERIASQKSVPWVEAEPAATVEPSAALLNVIDESAPAEKPKPLVANSGQFLGVSGHREQTAQQVEGAGKDIPAGREAVATVQPSAPPLFRKSSRYLDPQEVKMLIARGQQLMATGDVSAARGMFLRAAESEDPDAALALGAAYDPDVLLRLGVIGIASDLEKAGAWYAKAESWGSVEARRRLEVLKR
jgi:hypothetical protein